MTEEWRSAAQRLTQALIDSGHLTEPVWQDAFRAVPRHACLPARTLDEAYADDVVLTQTRTITLPSGATVEVPTSSSSAPSLMAVMLERLDLSDGMTVLEIGVGTGYNAALLCHRLGDHNVTSVDIDLGLVDTAREALARLGRRPTLATADGYHGHLPRAPYHRIIATCAVTHVPPAWIRQLAPGGRIVAPLAMDGYPLAVLDKTSDDEVTGH
ncbi:MAG: methyltransferase domain-containing protein, partial [Micromonosporaceae bacterium]